MSRTRDGSSARVAVALLAVAAAGLAARLWSLGWRVAHQDEARVAHWTLQYMELGAWEYRAIIHGPFLPHVNGVVFDLLGPSDFTMRLVVAVVGGLLVLSAWLFRSRLSDVEVVALGAFLAANPVLLYYSRFMRNDVLLAAFMLTALGCFVRFVDTRRARYLYAGAFVFALAFTTKENSLLYPVCWLGALVLVFDGRMVLAEASDDEDDPGRYATAKQYAGRVLRGAWRHKLDLALSAFVAAVVVVAFYAPKPGFYQLFSNPGIAGDVLHTATVGSYEEFADLWGSTSTKQHSYIAFLEHDLDVLVAGGTTLVAFSLLGFLHDRYATEQSRPLVAFCFYWGAFSVFGYPAVSDIAAGWTAVNALVPLAVPAAAGVGVVVRYGRRGVETGDATKVRVAVAVLVVAAAGTGAVAAETSYASPQSPENPLVQYAQPGGEMQPTIRDVKRISAANDGVDVLYYDDEDDDAGDGLEFHRSGDDDFNVSTGPPAGWHDRLPFPWYLAHVDANTTSVQTPSAFPADPPPVVISVASEEDDFAPQLDGDYERHAYPRYLTDTSRTLVVYVDQSALPADA
jgi:uncharacterized protein (TIGR03663 family)